MKKLFLENKKTTVQAVLIGSTIALYVLKVIDTEKTTVLIGLFTSLGLIGSKDA